AWQCRLYSFEVVGQHSGIAGPFLTKRQRSRILHMGASYLDNVVPSNRFRAQRVPQLAYSRDQTLPDVYRRGDVHGRWKRVVGGLRHVDVVIRMNGCLAAKRSARQLGASVRNDFVHIHIELCAAASHPDVQWKHVMMLAGEDFVTD